MNGSFQEWWDRLNGLIHRACVLMLAALIIAQAILVNQTLRTFVSRTDRLEGKSIAESQLFIKRGEIEISAENIPTLSPLVFYINGKSVGAPLSRTIMLEVKDNDVLEVSGGGYDSTVILKVTAVSENMIVPEAGKLIYVNNNLVMVDRVRLR